MQSKSFEKKQKTWRKLERFIDDRDSNDPTLENFFEHLTIQNVPALLHIQECYFSALNNDNEKRVLLNTLIKSQLSKPTLQLVLSLAALHVAPSIREVALKQLCDLFPHNALPFLVCAMCDANKKIQKIGWVFWGKLPRYPYNHDLK